MKKGIYLTIITIITVICIIGGSLYHLVNFLSFLPFHTTSSSSSTKEVASSASEPLDAFQNIVADTDVADITVCTGDDYSIDYQATTKLAPKYEVKNGTLTIQQTVKHTDKWGIGTPKRRCKITITIPAETSLDSIDIDGDVGDITVTGITSSKLVTDNAVGDTEIKQCTIPSIETDSAVGDTDIIDCNFNKLDVDGDVGDITVQSKQDLSDYKMECDTSIGKVSVNHHSHKDNYSQRGKAGTIILDNSTGDISVSY